MNFQKGLNVIIGSNNSGKTGLLRAIEMLSKPEITSAHDFNKNILSHYDTKFQTEAPEIIFEFEIRHEISEDDTEDESIVKLIPFLGMEDIEVSKKLNADDKSLVYDIVAVVKMKFALNIKAINDYIRDVKDISSLDEFLSLLDTYLERYTWTFNNGKSETQADKKDVVGIFDIRFIEAERSSADVAKETRREIERFVKDQNNAMELQKRKKTLTEDLKEFLNPALNRMSVIFENENNEIGLGSGNISIFQNIRPDIRIADAYVTEVKDTQGNFIVPLENNGLGYNNLINIYMLIKLNEIRRGKDFRILCLEEPEAHLHPSMQYKLFKFLKNLDETDGLSQQIFVTTHSSNISAVAGIDNMYMLDYCRTGEVPDCRQQSLKIHFEDKKDAKKHLTKFLDVTRSDMLFADKVILVEGIAEKLLLPLFMEKCSYPYEDGNISIVEIGGRHFQHFIELFNGNAVNKKVLCITDKDFTWIYEDNSGSVLSKYCKYKTSKTPHIENLKASFNIENFEICTQSIGGRTFEDELFLTNFSSANGGNKTIANELFKIVANINACQLLNSCGFDFYKWYGKKQKNNSVVYKYLEIFKNAIDEDIEHAAKYEALFFAELFLYYAERKKGDLALEILSNEKLASDIIVPQYIKEGLEWLSK